MLSKQQFQFFTFLVVTIFIFGKSHAFTSPGDIPMTPSPNNVFQQQQQQQHQPKHSIVVNNKNVDQLRQEWIDRSVDYYSKVMREERRRNMGQIAMEEFSSEEYKEDFKRLAKKHYFALRKIKDGQHRHAELIYRKIIDEILAEEQEGHCDHAKLAVTTLLLALHCQRMGDLKKTRSVFLNFFRVVVVNDSDDSECACTAKVLGAYALFEMKQGNVIKSLEIARIAVQFDQALEPVLNWKQFRDAEKRKMDRLRP